MQDVRVARTVLERTKLEIYLTHNICIWGDLPMDNQRYNFGKPPICEACQKKEAMSFSLIAGEWKFTCMCIENEDEYFIFFEEFFYTAAATVKWLSHLSLQAEMDWRGFGEMMHRFRESIRKPSVSG